jgi:hypothetical protein
MSNDTNQDGDVSKKKPSTKGFKATSKRLREGKENNLSNRACLNWRQDSESVCRREDDKFTGDKRTYDIVPIDDVVEMLSRSRTGSSLLEQLGDVEVRYDTQVPGSQFYPRDGKSWITLNPWRPKGDLVNMLAREVRRAWQHVEGALINPLEFEPDEAILVNRAQMADVMMIGIKIAWELKLAGENEAWDYLVGSPMADIGRTFEVKVQGDFRTLNNGEAPRAAYDKFFEDSRTKMHDKRIIHQMLLDETGYMKSKTVRPKVSMDLFSKLGSLPHGRNYLSMKSTRAPTDACYATVEDRSNANFLWFIKFERSFQEKELQMIEQSVKLSAEIVDFAKWSAKERRS